MATKSYAGAGVATTLVSNINSGSLSFQVTATTGWPNTSNGPFVIEVSDENGNVEKMLVDSYDGSGNLTIDAEGRGYDGTTAESFDAGDEVQLVWDAVSAQDANEHIYVTSRDDHSQYLDTARHDVTTRHAFGAALGTPGTPTSVVGATSGAAGSGASPARSDHQHAGLPTPGSTGLFLQGNTGDANDVAWSAEGITTQGDMIYGASGGAVARLPIGTTGETLQVVGGQPAWATPEIITTYAPGTTVESYIASSVTGIGASPSNITSVSLTAGTWLVMARGSFYSTSTGIIDMFLNETGASTSGALAADSVGVASSVPDPANISLFKSVTVVSTTTIYLEAMITSGSCTATAFSASGSIGGVTGITAVRTA